MELLKGFNFATVHWLGTVLWVNGSQLAEIKKSIPDMSPEIKFIGMKQLV